MKELKETDEGVSDLFVELDSDEGMTFIYLSPFCEHYPSSWS
jgi:hypothetical protein